MSAKSEDFHNGMKRGREYLLNTGFDESKHPRGEGGKFGAGGSASEKSKSSVGSVIKEFESSGWSAHHYPKLGRVSINGGQSIPEKEAVKRMRETMTAHKEKERIKKEKGLTESEYFKSEHFKNGSARGKAYLESLGLWVDEAANARS